MNFSLAIHKLSLALALSLVGLFFAMPVAAKEVDIIYNNEYFVESTDRIRVVETHTIRNNSTNSIIKQENTDVFVISHLKSRIPDLNSSVATATIKVDGKRVPYTVQYKETHAELIVQYPRKIGVKDSLTFTLEYQNKGLLEKTGALFDIYVPGIPKDAAYENSTQSFGYNTTLYINEGLFPEQNFIIPKPTTVESLDNGVTKYYFNRDTIAGKTIWVQRGRKQFYKFKILQKAEPTMNNNMGFQNEYSLVIPRDVENAEIYQNVFIDKILPLPERMEKDSDGNLIAHFKVPSTEKSEILIEGFVEVGVTGLNIDENNAGSVADIDKGQFSSSLSAAEYWEVNNPEIINVASEVSQNASNIYDILGRTFSYVVNKIDYSDLKRFGINDRQGALETLRQGSGVCMEYSDLFLSLARASGVPSRAVFGYGYDPKEDNDKQESHQWVVSYLPGLGKWFDMDVTWGDSGQVAEGGYLNHFYTHIVSDHPNALPEVSLKSFGTGGVLELPEYEIAAIEALPKDLQLLRQVDLLQNYPNTPKAAILDLLLQIPLKVSAFFGNVSNKDAISIALLTVGFALLIVPVVLLVRHRKDFGAYKNENEVVVP